MQAHFLTQMRDLNSAKQFRSAKLLGTMLEKSRIIQRDWVSFKIEYGRTLYGLCEYDATVHLCMDIIEILEHSETTTITEAAPSRPALLATVKILWADCLIKMKRTGEALKKYRSLASKEHTLESMMNLASCVALAEPEYGASKIYQEILSRWPYAMEAAYELSKLNVPFEQAVSMGINANVTASKSSQGASEVLPLASTWLSSCYRRWAKIAEGYKGTIPLLLLDTEKQEAEEKIQLESDRKSQTLPLTLPKPIDDPLQLLTCVNLALYRGAYGDIELLMKRARLPEEMEMFGQEFEAFADFKTGRRTRLTLRQSEAMAKSPFRWETWFVTAIKEWSDRKVSNGLESLNRAQQLAPASTMLCVVRGYMQLFRVKDVLLRSMVEEDDGGQQHRMGLREAMQKSLEAIRDAWSMSKDPFVTQCLLEIHTSIARLVTDVKVIEVIAEVDAKNPLLKRFKTNSALCLTEASENPALGKIYARLLSRKARLCVCKHGLVQMAIESANNALKFDPENGLAKATLILADRVKSAGGAEKPLEELEDAASKASTAEAKWLISMEAIPLMLELGQLEKAQNAITKFHPINPLDNEVIYYTELIRIRMESEMEDEEEEEDEGEEDI